MINVLFILISRVQEVGGIEINNSDSIILNKI